MRVNFIEQNDNVTVALSLTDYTPLVHLHSVFSFGLLMRPLT